MSHPKLATLLLVAILPACATAPAPGPASGKELIYVPASVKLLVGPGGIQATLVRPAGTSPDTILIRLDATSTVLDGKVLAYKLDRQRSKRHKYHTNLHGHYFAPLAIIYEPKGIRYELTVPGSEGSYPMHEDATRAGELAPAAIVALHEKQKAAGILADLQEFSRDRRVKKLEAQLTTSLAQVNQACGSKIAHRAEWVSFPDELIRGYSLASVCATPLRVIRDLCKAQSAREILSRSVREVVCRRGAKAGVAFAEGKLTYTTAPEEPDGSETVKRYLLQAAAFGPGGTLGARIDRENTRICKDDKSHFIGVGPVPGPERGVFFGDGKVFTRVRPPDVYVSHNSFFDPREINPTASKNFRGVDYRFYSSIVVDDENRRCKLRCGEREVSLGLLETAAKNKLLAGARFEPPLPRRRPYAMARDRKGIYYFIDRDDAKGARDFRLFRGPKGNLKKLEMIDVVLDSKGDVFATPSGELRLIIEKENSYWVQGKKTQPLLNLPLDDNLHMIFTELGVYIGKPYGTPCDML